MADIDFRGLVETPDQVDATLQKLPLPATSVRDSGGGRHVSFELKEPIDADDTGYFVRACQVMKRLCRGAQRRSGADASGSTPARGWQSQQ